MYLIGYSEKYPYRYTELGHLFPVLTVAIRNPTDAQQIVEVDVYIDSGAQISVLQGWIAGAIGLDILNGRPWRLQGASGWGVTARRLRVEFELPDGHAFALEPAFALNQIDRNLLGRDLFDLVQLGFREHHSEFYLEPAP